MAVGGTSTLRFKPTSGSASVGTGVTATVASGATLELAGTVSALSSGPNRVNIANNSSSAGILVTGTNQQVGSISGSGTTQVNAGSDLTANQIIQSALVIGGTAGNNGVVTIDASDASGKPLGQPSGLALAGSLSASGPFGEGVISSTSMSSIAADSTDLAVPAAGNSVGIGNASPVPEPSTLLLVLLAVLNVVSTHFVRHHFRCQAVSSAPRRPRRSALGMLAQRLDAAFQSSVEHASVRPTAVDETSVERTDSRKLSTSAFFPRCVEPRTPTVRSWVRSDCCCRCVARQQR